MSRPKKVAEWSWEIEGGITPEVVSCFAREYIQRHRSLEGLCRFLDIGTGALLLYAEKPATIPRHVGAKLARSGDFMFMLPGLKRRWSL